MKASARTATAVYRQLLDDFPKEALDWIRAAQWFGPVDVRTDRIDFSNEKEWAAYHEPERVAKMVERGIRKPVILVQTPNKPKLTVIDGHHRSLGAKRSEQPVPAYIARVHATSGPWDTLHDSQKHGPSIVGAAAVSAGAHALDLSIADVHQPGANVKYRKGPPTAPTKDSPMSDLTAKQRNQLPASKFADPANRKYPIHNKAHADDAMARLNGEKSSMSTGKYAKIKSRIRAAQRRFGEKPKANAMTGSSVRVRARLGAGGHLHITHAMNNGVAATARFAVALASGAAGSDADKPVWIQLAKSGHFKGHGAGEFYLNAAVFAQILRNFREVNQSKVPFDFEHASAVAAAAPNSGNTPTEGAPAQGWIHDLKVDGTNLFALVAWKEPARTYIKEGKYQHVSPVIKFGFKDPVTGENMGARLVSAALTNDPFLTGMQPVAASAALANGEHIENALEVPVADADTNANASEIVMRSSPMTHHPNEYMGRLKAALGMSELSSAVDCSAELERLRAMHDGDMGGDRDGMHEGVYLDKYRMPMRDLVAASPGDTWEHVFDVVQDLIDAAIDEHNIEKHGEAPEMTATGADAEDLNLNNAGADAGLTGAINMADENKSAVALTAAQAELDKTKAELAAANAKIATAEAQASEFSLKLTAAEAQQKQTGDQVALLLSAQQARDTKELESKVDAAIRDYPEKGLTVAMRDSLINVAKTNGAFFDSMYPAKNPATAHLLTNLTGARPNGAPPASLDNGGGAPGGLVMMSVAGVAELIAVQKKVSLEAAQTIAMNLAGANTVRRPAVTG